jgi:hypothetical protein
LKKGETIILKGSKRVTGVDVYLSALRLADGELLIVATGAPRPDAIACYGLRWEIETLFGCLKSRGFNFEDTHVTDRRRIKRLFVVAVIAFCWAHLVGEWVHEKVNKIKIKSHGRFAKSIFRTGLDLINEVLYQGVSTGGLHFIDLFKFIDLDQYRRVT